jgi:GNAT superfamily N-acetyltransferase
MIRRAYPGDAAELAELAARTYRQAFAADTPPDDMAAFLVERYGVQQQGAELADPDFVTLVAEEEGRLVGFVQICRNPAPECVQDEVPVEVKRFYVDQLWHGRGVAQQLMAAVPAVARELGSAKIWLGVWERNPRAIAFYQKHGFRDVGSHDFWVGSDRQTDRVMVAEVEAL